MKGQEALISAAKRLDMLRRLGFDVSKQMNRLSNAARGYGMNLNRMLPRLRRFRMELLSVMFFGMALQRAFMGMIKPAFDMVKIFDILNITLGVIFLPIALLLMEALLPIGQWFIELPDSIKLCRIFISRQPSIPSGSMATLSPEFLRMFW